MSDWNGGRVSLIEPQRFDQIRAVVISIMLTISVALLIASIVPRPLFMPAMEGVLFIAAVATSIGAVLRREPMWSPIEINSWDRSLILFTFSLAFGVFIDHAAVAAFLEQTTNVEAGDG